MILSLKRRTRGLGDGVAAVLAALDEPAALVAFDGAVLTSNASWRARVGDGHRLPAEWSVYPAFRQARSGARGEGQAAGRRLGVRAAGAGAFLVRLDSPAQESALDDAHLSGGGPFGSATIRGDDPFDGQLRVVNEALVALAGEGATLSALIADRSLEEARARVAAGDCGPFDIVLAGAPERSARLHLTATEGGWRAWLVDISEQKQLRSQLAQRNRMESVGLLAGGVAHDFNNLLTAIRLRTDELLLRHALGDPSYDSLAEIRETVGRAADVVRQLLTFSRRATLQREVIDLGEALTDTAVLLRRLVREDVELTIDYGQNMPLVRIDRSQLETAVINLVVNARDALRAKGGGTVRVRTARLSQGEACALGYDGPEACELAFLEVADDGPGIRPEALEKIFEPFFTTKAVGEGTGLGLATVYGVVRQADGVIVARSELGSGAAFRIFLPVHVPPLAFEPAAQEANPRKAPRDLSGVGRILFVEDEPAVRVIAARLLRARGYEVVEAADGIEALELARTHAGTIDLMISDVIMPGLDGPTLLKEARPHLGAIPVMFISGYAEAEFSDLLEGETGVSFLAKPLDIKTLAERVKAQLRPADRAA